MENTLTKKLMCVQMRSGVEIWVENDRAVLLQDILEKITMSKFVRFQDETFNTADVVGVFSAETMAEVTRRKNGAWKCQNGTWHDRDEKCACIGHDERKRIEKREEAIKNCGKCTRGYVQETGGVRLCDCQSGI
jgi:hypothetical protein